MADLRNNCSGKIVWQVIIALFVVLFGIVVAVVLVKTRKPPARVDVPVLSPLVSTIKVDSQDSALTVSGYGTVEPRVEVRIVPQVSGNVVEVGDSFKAGGYVGAGTLLFQIDKRDYELAVQQARALVAEAKVKLEIEQSEAQVAVQEWQQLNPGKEPSSKLVFREPQIKQAKAALESAKAKLQIAELNLDRTSVSLPVDAKIIDETVDLGQYVVVGQSVGSAYGVDVMEIEVPLEDDELKWFYIPLNSVQSGEGNYENFADATVNANFAGKSYSWRGKVVRTTGQIDRKSRMISVIVQVRDAVNPDSGKPPLLPGAFTEVFIEGKVLEDVFILPRSAVHNDNEVWIADGNSLRIEDVDVARFDKEYAYITSGISAGQEIITTPLEVVTEGMSIRVESESGSNMQVQAEDANGVEQSMGGAL